jgi:hypothetical protein
MKSVIPRDDSQGWQERERLYGSYKGYAVSKRQLSKREKKLYGLISPA